MPRGQLTKDIIKCEILKIKRDLYNENIQWTSDPRGLIDKYLNKVLDKVNEYRQ
jgi:hypothetical protein